jgi:signal transduction histidine kinase
MTGRAHLRAMSAGEPPAPLSTFDGRGRLAGYLAHELRTPLATQRALLELALADRNADVAGWREVGEDVLRACRQQERLLEACLALARSELGPQRSDPVDLGTIAANALRAYDLSALETIAKFEPAWTSGDPDLLERLVACERSPKPTARDRRKRQHVGWSSVCLSRCLCCWN